MFIVERTYKVAAILWPMLETKPRLWVTQVVVFNINDWEALPCQYISPYHLRLLDLVCILRQKGAHRFQSQVVLD